MHKATLAAAKTKAIEELLPILDGDPDSAVDATLLSGVEAETRGLIDWVIYCDTDDETENEEVWQELSVIQQHPLSPEGGIPPEAFLGIADKIQALRSILEKLEYSVSGQTEISSRDESQRFGRIDNEMAEAKYEMIGKKKVTIRQLRSELRKLVTAVMA